MLKLRQSKEGVQEDPRAQKKMRFVNERHECFVGPFYGTNRLHATWLSNQPISDVFSNGFRYVSDRCVQDASVTGLESNTLRIDEPEERIFVFICLMRSPAKLELIRPIFCLKKCALEVGTTPRV